MSTFANADAFATEAGSAPTVMGTDTPAAATPLFYTEADLARVRSQEKDKLYPQIDNLKEELAALKKERDDEAARKASKEAEKASKEAEAEKKKQEEELELRDLLSKKEQEWTDQLGHERQERERAFALLEREKNFAEIQSYRQTRIEQIRESVIPELVDLIQGNTVEEIDASIAGLQERSSRILDNVQQATQAARRDMTGTRVTTPPAGPLDINSGNKQFTAEDISSMSMNEYAKYRQQLLSDRAQGRSQGLFG
jgi:hypothetical protein